MKSICLPVISLALLTLSSNAHSLSLLDSRQIQLSGGQPVTEQNVDVSTFEIEYQQPLWMIPRYQVGVDWAFGGGTLDTEVENAPMVFSGLGLRWEPWQYLMLRADGKVRYLSEHRFQAEQGRAKDYGGRMQYSYSFSMLLNVQKDLQFGYRYQHMSNGGMYEVNPALNTHNLVFGYRF
ncbi:Lipid A 3-O-deacylase-related protein [Ferrimonas balearica DSM 9799]|uniref:Lipid A 3-O-deacylase-related protein n=1 Tax=Ferrimonas balearica (strain DSM 9799 / CCM 4581 / KCTC 23876 / PAT) TaxID=550540 RepID=E1SP00_FERBD|nr:acyloxyacyl hydrolase [Ferrimonas balearica]ADN74649.1 Lipid A 3-O-deacylase-related protein [Ferrimonas balearica DSM 9799]